MQTAPARGTAFTLQQPLPGSVAFNVPFYGSSEKERTGERVLVGSVRMSETRMGQFTMIGFALSVLPAGSLTPKPLPPTTGCRRYVDGKTAWPGAAPVGVAAHDTTPPMYPPHPADTCAHAVPNPSKRGDAPPADPNLHATSCRRTGWIWAEGDTGSGCGVRGRRHR